jgi:hypothetical protein
VTICATNAAAAYPRDGLVVMYRRYANHTGENPAV